MTPANIQFDGDKHAALTVLLAHGAGAPMDSPFMGAMAEGLAARGFGVARFEFPYMAKRRQDGKRRGPDKADKLLESYQSAIDQFDPARLIIGGKSLGGRMASMIADTAGVRGLVCLGYPFHPPGKPEKMRTSHLETLTTPALILQGERDTFGTRADVEAYKLSASIKVHWLADGDHSFKPRKKSGITETDNLEVALNALGTFLSAI
jgi:predicted alpha/beta-hydrolase family hydrolase